MKIIGAGLAGLLAAHAWPGAEVLEADTEPRAAHRALLRFRSTAVAELVGIEFRGVTVRKGIWMEKQFAAPNIQLANYYAQKVTGSFSGDRSIWDLEPVQRFIAPEDLYEQLIQTVNSRIHWATRADFSNRSRLSDPIVNTSPLPLVLKSSGVEADGLNFQRASIRVKRFRLKNADVFQTVYFPDPELALYRASVSGSLLICESTAANTDLSDSLSDAFDAFGIQSCPKLIDSTDQRFGKIVPIPTPQRQALLHRLTAEHAIFSLGRFATWRNILLDDVVQDIGVIRRLIKASGYERALFAT